MNVEFTRNPWIRRIAIGVGLLAFLAVFHLPLPADFPVAYLAQFFSVKAATIVGWLVDLFAFGFMFVVGLALISQFALPARTWDQRVQAVSRIFDYTFGASGPVVFVKEGRLVASQSEMARGGAGVALVDSTSAIVVERGARFSRAEGPGIVFLQPGERIRSTLDLRWQSRSQPVAGLTKDGIEVKTTLHIVFGLAAGPGLVSVSLDPTAPIVNTRRMKRPYPFDSASAFRAIYGTSVGKEAPVMWTDLPAITAAERFRTKLARETLDGLLRPTILRSDPLKDMDEDVTKEVRDRGLDGLVFANSIDPSRPEVKEPLILPEGGNNKPEAEEELRLPEEITHRLKFFMEELTQDLRDEPMLRDRGVEVRSVTLGALDLPPQVMQQRLDSWEAPWQKSANVALAAGELQGEVIKQRAQHKAQLEVTNIIRAALKTGGQMWTVDDKERTRRRILGALRLLASTRNRVLHSGDALRIMAQMDPPKDSEDSWLKPMLEELRRPASTIPAQSATPQAIDMDESPLEAPADPLTDPLAEAKPDSLTDLLPDALADELPDALSDLLPDAPDGPESESPGERP